MIPEALTVALRSPECRTGGDERALLGRIKKAKATAVRGGDEDSARHLWCLETILAIQRNYCLAFDGMKSGAFYQGWCFLAAVERHLVHLARHHALNDYQLEFIRTQTARFQSLYPYRVFLSPAYVVQERRCGICDALITPRKGCAHRKGDIYGGEMCGHRLRIQITMMSLVDQPVGKERVAFLSDPDSGRLKDYDYSVIEYVVAGLASPYHGWNFEWTKRLCSHRHFADVSGDAPCPCGSGRAYEACCLHQAGVTIPHCDVTFDVVPAREHLEVRYLRGGARR